MDSDEQEKRIAALRKLIDEAPVINVTVLRSGLFCVISIRDESLTITLTVAGKQFLESEETANISDLLEDLPSLELLTPDEIGVSPCDLILGFEVDRDDHGNIIDAEGVWYFEESSIKSLRENGAIILKKV